MSPKPKAKPTASETKRSAKVRLKPTPPRARKPRSTPKQKIVVSVSAPLSPLQLPKGVLLGAHTSTSGGVAQAIKRAQACGFTAAQIFVKNNKQWLAPPLSSEEISHFRQARQASGIFVFAHNSYLVNLGSPDPVLFATSVKAMIAELERAESLAMPFIVMHPGSHGGSGEEAGLQRITQGLNEIVRATPGFHCRMALEVTAGQGNALGYKLEHLSELLKRVEDGTRFGTCLDTAHLYAAGYDVKTRKKYEETVCQVEKWIGIPQVLALHLNDSKVPLGKRVDRHALLGDGEIGMACFEWIVQDPRWAGIPKILETPKSEDMHEDVESLAKLAPYLQ